MQHPHYSQGTTSEPTACTAPSPDSAAIYSEPNSLCRQADPRACHGCSSCCILVRALQAPTNASASASASASKCKCNANSAFYKYSTCLQTSSALSPSLLAPLFKRPGLGPGTPGRLLYLRCDPQLVLRCDSPSHVRILSASCPHSPSPTEVAASIVSFWWCPTTTALRDADPRLLGKPNARYW
jgi:hypothetical protein